MCVREWHLSCQPKAKFALTQVLLQKARSYCEIEPRAPGMTCQWSLSCWYWRCHPTYCHMHLPCTPHGHHMDTTWTPQKQKVMQLSCSSHATLMHSHAHSHAAHMHSHAAHMHSHAAHMQLACSSHATHMPLLCTLTCSSHGPLSASP